MSILGDHNCILYKISTKFKRPNSLVKCSSLDQRHIKGNIDTDYNTTRQKTNTFLQQNYDLDHKKGNFSPHAWVLSTELLSTNSLHVSTGWPAYTLGNHGWENQQNGKTLTYRTLQITKWGQSRIKRTAITWNNTEKDTYLYGTVFQKILRRIRRCVLEDSTTWTKPVYSMK